MECSFNYKYSYSNNTHRLSYDLCPLFLHHQPLTHEIIEDTPPTQTKHIYDIALGVGINKDGTLPAELQCPSNSFICLTVINTRPNHPSEPPRILQVVPVSSGDIRPKFRITNTTTGTDIIMDHLQLTVHGLEYMKQKQKAVFHMQCDKAQPDDVPNARLEFLYTWNGTHVFNWKTTYGCPEISELPDESEGGPEGDDDSEERLPPPDPEPDEGIVPPPGSSLSPLSFGFAIMFVFFLLRVVIPRRYQRSILRLGAYVPGQRPPRAGDDVPLEEIPASGELRPLKSLIDSSIPHHKYIL
ncbi:hypothetical protein D9756_009418 [Leucocoprinus leucothites]|uniref:Autophagy-related protein 27 n=1 Tax=Leucocoprinus leucothites TaxID=201217 RepID=A0A8H5FUJ3_9AGAR|nr:hypothetical protein D9756_009418 [Leucoagaricus leucothites]